MISGPLLLLGVLVLAAGALYILRRLEALAPRIAAGVSAVMAIGLWRLPIATSVSAGPAGGLGPQVHRGGHLARHLARLPRAAGVSLHHRDRDFHPGVAHLPGPHFLSIRDAPFGDLGPGGHAAAPDVHSHGDCPGHGAVRLPHPVRTARRNLWRMAQASSTRPLAVPCFLVASWSSRRLKYG